MAMAFLLVMTGCGGNDAPSTDEEPEQPNSAPDQEVELDQVPADPPEDVPSALDSMTDDAFPEALVDPREVISGGPPPDGIPAIDEPRFEKAGDIDWLNDAEGVLSVTVEGETRGYPLQVLMWHEIANDTVGGVPIAATYCPLCNSGVAFNRRVGDRVLSFGTSGRLYNANLVMYDRQTESLWPQLTGRASIGVLTGEKLESIPMIPVAWQDFREAHPEAWVLSRETGFSRTYGENPYIGYDDPDTGLLFDPGVADDRLDKKERVLALTADDDVLAVRRDAVADSGVLSFEFDGRDVVAFHQSGQASALDSGAVAGGAEIGSVAVYEPMADGQELTFAAADDGFVDDQTGTTWNILGEAVAGPLEGEQLPAVEFTDTFWFAWAAFQPDTRVVP